MLLQIILFKIFLKKKKEKPHQGTSLSRCLVLVRNKIGKATRENKRTKLRMIADLVSEIT